jgi:hypothetical protein
MPVFTGMAERGEHGFIVKASTLYQREAGIGYKERAGPVRMSTEVSSTVYLPVVSETATSTNMIDFKRQSMPFSVAVPGAMSSTKTHLLADLPRLYRIFVLTGYLDLEHLP